MYNPRMISIPKLNPWTQEIIAEVPQMGALEFIQALQKSKQAQEIFKKTSFEERADFLRRWAEIASENKNQIAREISIEQGLPYQFVLDEVVDAAQKSIENLSLDVRLFPNPQNLSPTGIIGMSLGWPMAYLWISHHIAQALAAGNGVILKVPSLAPVSAQKVFEILKKMDLPEGLIQFLYGPGKELTPLLAGHPGIQGYVFQGHFRHSNGLIEAVAQRRKKSQFFLGGKNSSLIHGDFDFVNHMEALLRPALLGQGQLGVNTHRFFVTQAQEKKFYEALTSYLAGLKPSTGPDDLSPWTPLVSAGKKDEFQSFKPQIIHDQGQVLSGLNPGKGFFEAPIFTRDLSNCSELQQDEVAGPLFVVTAVKYIHEMVKWANTGYLGQSAIFWGPQEKSQNLLAQLQVGQGLYQNWGNFLSWQVPQKQSFYGIPDVKWSGRFYSDVKNIGA